MAVLPFVSESTSLSTSLALNDLVKWGVVGVLLFFIYFVEDKGLESIKLSAPSSNDILHGVFAGIAALYLAGVVATPIREFFGIPASNGAMATLLAAPFTSRLFMAITAGVTEEILYRGYPIERIDSLTGSLVFAAIITGVIFVGIHVPFWGLGAAIQQGVMTAAITAVYVWRRNLWTVITMHTVIDVLVLVVFPIAAA